MRDWPPYEFCEARERLRPKRRRARRLLAGGRTGWVPSKTSARAARLAIGQGAKDPEASGSAVVAREVHSLSILPSTLVTPRLRVSVASTGGRHAHHDQGRGVEEHRG